MKQLIGEVDFTIWPRISLIGFFVFFFAACLWAYRPGSKRQYEKDAHLPLED